MTKRAIATLAMLATVGIGTAEAVAPFVERSTSAAGIPRLGDDE